ncbi:TPA: DUF1269 domain-containing protein, partial [Escherichia coli]|nr:DUF1269 domain-containing protein [Escherichia coli]
MSDTWSSVEENPERVFRDTHPEGNPASDILYLLEQNWSRFVSSFILTERLKNRARRVDGLIIGTGESDFTKGNTHYDLCIDDKVFRLIDVPGIEGNENCYADLVKEAVAQAHLVVYVNGTNKKPEATTARKIKSYLEYGTQVYPLINVRGYSEAYEFDEDRIDLEQQGRAGDALCQTVGVLASVLG